MKAVAFFNNKGGVGKTTLICNVASHFAMKLQHKVLIVDCDPQCNTTQLLLSDDNWSKLYEPPAETKATTTLLNIVRPLEVGEATIDESIKPMRSSTNRFRVDLIPGHPRMSIIEDLLSRSWGETTAGDIGGIRKTNWAAFLNRRFSDEYDVLFFDLGPSLGSLNRTVLLGCDYFMTPMGADIFSIVGIRNIADWLNSWLQSYHAALTLCDTKYPKARDEFGINTEVPIAHGFAGYTVQQYITKSKKGQRRPTVAFERILKRVPVEIKESLGEFFVPDLTPDSAKLGDVPSMFSLIPLAQSANAPIASLTGSDGIVGAQYRQQEVYAEVIANLANSLARNIGMGR